MMSGENVLKILTFTEEFKDEEFFRQLLKNLLLKNFDLKFCPDIPSFKSELLISEFDFLILNVNNSSIDIPNLLKWFKEFRVNIPGLIIYSDELSIIDQDHFEHLNLSKISPELIEKIILSAIEKQKLLSKLNKSEQKWKYLNSISTDIIWDWDIKSNFLTYNSNAWAKIFEKDFNNGKMLFEKWLEYIDVSDRERLERFFNRIIADPDCTVFEVDYKMSVSGRNAYLTEKGYIERDQEGNAKCVIGFTRNITRKITIEREIKRLSQIAEETLNGVIITDAQGRITWSNRSFAELSGYSSEEILDKKPGDFLQGPETSKIAIRFMSGKLKRERPFKCDLINYKKSGEKYWVRIFCQPQFDDNGKLESYFAILADISSEKEASQQILDNEKKFRALIENSKDGLSIIYPDAKRVDILAGLNILGYSSEEYYDMPSESYIHPDDLNKVRSAFYEILQDPSKSESREYRAYKKGIGYIWIESTFHNMLNVPSVNAIVSNFRDINDRKISEELLRLSEEKYRILFNENPLVLIVWDPQTYRVLEVNDMACREYGYKRTEFIGLDLRKIILTDYLPRFIKYAVELIKGTITTYNYSSVNVAKDGKLIYIDIVFQPFNYFGINASLAMIKNINEQVKLEKELSVERKEKQKQITEAVLKAQEQERAHIGRELHDNINQILATSRLYIEYAQRNPQMHDQLLLKARDFILSAIQEIRSLSKSVLPPSIADVGLIASLEDLLDTIRKINHFKLKTAWKIDEARLSKDLKLCIFRILQEQLNNIIRHSKAQNVFISIRQIKNKIVLVIKDDGVGFEKESESDGVGIKNIESRASLFNGTMIIETSPGNGTTLTVNFLLIS